MDLVIEGRFFINGELKDTAVGIEDGKIVTVGNIVRGGDESKAFLASANLTFHRDHIVRPLLCFLV